MKREHERFINDCLTGKIKIYDVKLEIKKGICGAQFNPKVQSNPSGERQVRWEVVRGLSIDSIKNRRKLSALLRRLYNCGEIKSYTIHRDRVNINWA